VKLCPSCGHGNADDARFCSQCAAPLDAEVAAREERKVVTCLFCDLVGFTARAERMDPEDVRRLLQPYHARVRRELERFGGTVEKFIGDAVMAVFGAPVAHEDDPERAVRAALAIRDQLTDEGNLEVRIGITTGEALIALDASPAAGEGMASGDVVNTAARLQSAAPTNGILVDEATQRATEGVIDYVVSDAVEAKGKAQRIPVWEASVARLPVGAERLGAAELVGRESELTLLRDAVEKAFHRREPNLVTIVGVPGIGKSRLLRELRARVDDAAGSVTWLGGRSLAYGEDVGFAAFREIVRTQAQILESDPSTIAESKLTGAVAALPLEDSDWVLRHLTPLLGIGAHAAGDGQRAERFAAWRRLLEGLAGLQPVVLTFEDLHWADDGLLDFVASLGEWLRDLPILAIGTARPDFLDRRPGWPAIERMSVIRLDALSDEATSELIEQLLPVSQLEPAARAALLEQAGGNPLYAEQYVRMVAEGGGGQGVPETVQALIVARLDGLPEHEKRVVQDASVTGDVFWSGAVAAASRDDRWTVEEHLRALERKAFVRRTRDSSVAGEAQWTFAHALVRDAAYSALPRGLRAERHLRVAEWIESLGRREDQAELLARHYLSAYELSAAAGTHVRDLSERVLSTAQQAGDRALALHAYASAAGFYRRALDLADEDDARRPRLLLELGRSLYLSEASGESELLEARAAYVRVGDLEGATEAELLLADLYRAAGDRELFERQLTALRSHVAELTPSDVKARAQLRIVGALTGEGRTEQALAAGIETLALIDELGSTELRAHALNVIGWARLELDDDGGFADLEQTIELGTAMGSPLALRGHANMAHHLRHRGDFTGSLVHLEEALRLVDRFGDVPMRRALRGMLPHNRYRQGRWDEAVAVADAYLDETGMSHFFAWHALGTRGLIRLSRGDTEGLEDSTKAIAAARDAVDPTSLPAALEVRSRCLIFTGRLDEARETAEEALALLETGISRAGFDLAHLVFAAIELGMDGERVLAVARRSKWAEAARLTFAGELGRAADVYGETGAVTDEAEARLRSGIALLEAGRQPEGEAETARALAFYRGVGATYYIRRGEAALARAGLQVSA
jgi:class 3 adenylate cyclase